jgi:hypothetical protein
MSGNVHDRGIVNVTSSSVATDHPTPAPKNVVDFDNKIGFASLDSRNEWICFDFKDRCIRLSHYSIRSYHLDATAAHARSWVIEGSGDHRNWVVQDERSNDNQLRGSY